MRAEVVAAAAAAAWIAPAPAPVVRSVATALAIPRTLPAGQGIAITFDDGPHLRGTPAVLQLLAEAGAAATFFLVGEQVVRRPALAAEIAAAGHEIGLHGFRHTLLLRRTPWGLADDLARGVSAIVDATGCIPAVYRPPYGVFSAAGVALARRNRWQPWLWSRWGRDWTRTATPTSIARLATRSLRSGDVVLLHDADYYSVSGSWAKTAAALPAIIDACGDAPLVTLSDST